MTKPDAGSAAQRQASPGVLALSEPSILAGTWLSIPPHVVAQRVFRRSTSWFYAHRDALVRDKGFPEPMPGGRYDPVALDRWREAMMPAHLRAGAGNDNAPADAAGALDDLLAARAAAQAGS